MAHGKPGKNTGKHYDRPNMGSGKAEDAARDIEDRKARMDKRMSKLFGADGGSKTDRNMESLKRRNK